MELVECKLLIELTDSTNFFGDSWNFAIDGYAFVKINEKSVEVTFSYDCQIERIVDGVLEHHGPSEWDKEYIEAEEKLQRLLDLICLEKSGIGMRIVEDSQRFTHRTGSASTGTHDFVVEMTGLADIKERYNRLNQMDDDKLADALRLNRLSSSEENVGEEIAQLWGAIESLYSDNIPKVLNTRDKRKEINKLIDGASLINTAEKSKLKESLAFVNSKSMPAIMAEKLKLANGDGTSMSDEEVTETLKYWRGTRSIQSHGSILIRDGDVHLLAGEMSHIIETILSAEVSPSKYVFVIFHPSQIIEGRYTDGKPVDDGKSGYLSIAIHKFASMDIEQNVRYQLKADDSCMYVIDYATIKKVTRDNTSIVSLDEIPEEIRESAIEKMKKLNHED